MPKLRFLCMMLPLVFLGCGKSDSTLSAANDCALAFKKVGFCASIKWSKAPEVRVLTTATLTFTKKPGGEQRPDAEVKVPSPRMPSMDHDSGKVPKTSLVENTRGDYRVENVYFNMRGKWSFTVNLVKDGAVVDTATHNLYL